MLGDSPTCSTSSAQQLAPHSSVPHTPLPGDSGAVWYHDNFRVAWPRRICSPALRSKHLALQSRAKEQSRVNTMLGMGVETATLREVRAESHMSRGKKEQERLRGPAAFAAKVLVRLCRAVKPSRGDRWCTAALGWCFKHVSCVLPQAWSITGFHLKCLSCHLSYKFPGPVRRSRPGATPSFVLTSQVPSSVAGQEMSCSPLWQ